MSTSSPILSMSSSLHEPALIGSSETLSDSDNRKPDPVIKKQWTPTASVPSTPKVDTTMLSPTSSTRRPVLSPGSGLSELSKQLRILQAKNESQRIEIDRLNRQLKILADLQGISVSDLRNALQIACQSEAYNELQSRVAYLRSQLEEASLLNSNKRGQHGEHDQKQLQQQIEGLNHQIATLQLKIGELEELDEKKKEQVKLLYQQLMDEKERNSNLEAQLQASKAKEVVVEQKAQDNQIKALPVDDTLLNESKREIILLKEKLGLLEHQLHASDEENKLRMSQYKARFYVQDERIEDLEQQLSSLYTAFTLMSQERNEELKQQEILKGNLFSADEEVAKQTHAASSQKSPPVSSDKWIQNDTGSSKASLSQSTYSNLKDTFSRSFSNKSEFMTPQKESIPNRRSSDYEKNIRNHIVTPTAMLTGSFGSNNSNKRYDSEFEDEKEDNWKPATSATTKAPPSSQVDLDDYCTVPIQKVDSKLGTNGTKQTPELVNNNSTEASSPTRSLTPTNYPNNIDRATLTLRRSTSTDGQAPFAESTMLPSSTTVQMYSNGDCVISGTLLIRGVNSIGIRKWKKHHVQVIAYDSHYQIEVTPADFKKKAKKYYSIHKNISKIERYTKHDYAFVLHVNFIDKMAPVLYCATEDEGMYKKWLSALSLATTTDTPSIATNAAAMVETELELLDAINGTMPMQSGGMTNLQRGVSDSRIEKTLTPEEQEAADLARALEASVNDFSMSPSDSQFFLDDSDNFDSIKNKSDGDKSL